MKALREFCEVCRLGLAYTCERNIISVDKPNDQPFYALASPKTFTRK